MMEITDADQAERLVARFQADEELTDEEIEALTTYLAKEVEEIIVSNEPVDADHGRLLKIAIRWARIQHEIYGHTFASFLF